jgi:hypothetical protein
MADTAPPANETASVLERVQALCRRAIAGDKAVLPELRRTLDAHPEMWREYGDAAAVTQRSWVKLAAGSDLLMQESLTRAAAALKAEVAGPDPSTLERLLADRIVATWLQVNHADALFAQRSSASPAERRELQRRQESAERRHEAALKQLALVRKLLRKAPSPLELLNTTSDLKPSRKTAPNRSDLKLVRTGTPVAN